MSIFCPECGGKLCERKNKVTECMACHKNYGIEMREDNSYDGVYHPTLVRLIDSDIVKPKRGRPKKPSIFD
jgi:DNA-directed RNA polymerase subunit M/transcription elongation factor TFIIS